MRNTMLMLIICVVAGCGGGAGSSSTGASPGASETDLGTRAFPDGSVHVSAKGLGQGGSANFRIAATGVEVIAVHVAIVSGDAAPPAGLQATADGTGRWRATLVLPSPRSTGLHLWTHLQRVDGTAMETSSDDFTLP